MTSAIYITFAVYISSALFDGGERFEEEKIQMKLLANQKFPFFCELPRSFEKLDRNQSDLWYSLICDTEIF